jgi:hypothetical protein
MPAYIDRHDRIIARFAELDRKSKPELLEMLRRRNRVQTSYRGEDKQTLIGFILESEFGSGYSRAWG